LIIQTFNFLLKHLNEYNSLSKFAALTKAGRNSEPLSSSYFYLGWSGGFIVFLRCPHLT
jgi:hypothetical protein